MRRKISTHAPTTAFEHSLIDPYPFRMAQAPFWHVVTAVIRRSSNKHILLLQRSSTLRTYPELWHYVSGSLEPSDHGNLFHRIRQEILEETGLPQSSYTILGSCSRPLLVNRPNKKGIMVHIALVRLTDETVPIRLNCENSSYRWVAPESLQDYAKQAVPKFLETYHRAAAAAAPFKSELKEKVIEDRSHGAAELAQWATEALLDWAKEKKESSEAGSLEELLELGYSLATARPDMTPIASAVIDILVAAEVLAEHGKDELAKRVSTAAEQSIEIGQARMEKLAGQGCEVLHRATQGDVGSGSRLRVITFSHSSTVRKVLLRFAEMFPDTLLEVIIPESRPLNEGVKLGKLLAPASSISPVLITDAQIGVFTQTANLALVGADSIDAEGNIKNKAGTLLLALAAREARVPIYAICESSKIGSVSHYRAGTAALGLEEAGSIEEQSADEVWRSKNGSDSDQEFAEKVRIRNVYFESTPAKLYSGIITEHGLLPSEETQKVAQDFDDNFKSLFLS